MSPKRIVIHLVCLSISIFASDLAQARKYKLGPDSGGQIQFGNAVPIPLQSPPGVSGTVLPPLLIPVVPDSVVEITPAGALKIPANVLSRPAVQQTLGVFNFNPKAYAVATNLTVRWPVAAATVSINGRGGAPTTTLIPIVGGNVRYTAPLTGKFGGPAQFAFQPGPPAGVNPLAPFTTYLIALTPTGNPACTHTSLTPIPFPGPGNPACIAALANALPTGVGAIGGPIATSRITPGGTPAAIVNGGPNPGIGPGKFGPGGTVTSFFPQPGIGVTDMATSVGYPFTVGKVTVSQPLAASLFTLRGTDMRLAGGTGAIQLVAGGMTMRALTGPGTVRAWINLDLLPPKTVTYEIEGLSNGTQWSWRIVIGGSTVASQTGVGPIVPTPGTEAAFATEFISSINANPGTSNCTAISVPSFTDQFTVSCPEAYTFIVGDATATPSSECTVIDTLGSTGNCVFNPTISVVGVSSSVPLLGPGPTIVLVAAMLALPFAVRWWRGSGARASR